MTNKLQPVTFHPLPISSIKPLGWLARQLRIQADGLSGNLDQFWPDVRDSRWFGGQAEGWERAPYWLDGFIPLAYLLKDEGMIARVKQYMTDIIDRQQDDGWLGPMEEDPKNGEMVVPAHYDLWAELLILKVMTVYHDASGDQRALDAIERALGCLDRLIDRQPLHNWGQMRWFEGLIAIYYLYERTGADWLLDLAVKLQAQGFHWGDLFQRWPYTEATECGRWNYMSHVVNNGMAVKSHGLWWQLTGDDDDRVTVDDMIAKLEKYHGMVTGMFTGDECLAGKSPTAGTELCSVNEYAYSLELLVSILGDPGLADRLEKVIFNALPATFSPDMWTHQYDQQVNQVECSIREGRTFGTNGPESNIFGLEPNYGCCTANLSQGWPKFTAHLWMRNEDGIVACAYAPSRVQQEIDSAQVSVTLETDYPFREELSFTVEVDRPVHFAMQLRIPSWAKNARIDIDGETLLPPAGQFFSIERDWQGTLGFQLILPMTLGLLPRGRGAVAIARGPLVYSLKVGEDWKRVNADKPYREPPHADYEIYPNTPWNYALAVDENHLTAQVKVFEHAIGDYPFSPQGAPVSLKVSGKRLDNWGMDGAGSASEVPLSPVQSDASLEELVLIPYGCTNLRVTEFPQLEE